MRTFPPYQNQTTKKAYKKCVVVADFQKCGVNRMREEEVIAKIKAPVLNILNEDSIH